MNSFQNNLDVYQRLIKMLAAQFGSTSEIVLHDLSEDYEKTIVAIENGHITGRKVGQCGSNLGLEILRQDPCSSNHDTFGYITDLKDGRRLRSSSMYFYDDSGRVVGALCINTDITALQQLSDLAGEMTQSLVKENSPMEVFASNIGELVDYYIDQYRNAHPRKPEEMDKAYKMDAIRFFDEKGVFLISKSGGRICQFLNMSKGTLYSYLDVIRAGKN